jgi:hypothetical protein
MHFPASGKRADVGLLSMPDIVEINDPADLKRHRLALASLHAQTRRVVFSITRLARVLLEILRRDAIAARAAGALRRFADRHRAADDHS